MFSILIAITVLAREPETQIMQSQPFQTEEACTEALANALNDIKGQATTHYGPDGYLLAGRCMKGVGNPA